jgi:hypothetical protein
MFGLPDAYGFRALGRHGDKGLESITATGLRGKVSNDEITVFCSGDSIISFACCGGFPSLQAESHSNNKSIAAHCAP